MSNNIPINNPTGAGKDIDSSKDILIPIELQKKYEAQRRKDLLFRVSTACIQGMLANRMTVNTTTEESRAKASVRQANALLKELGY